MKNKKIKKQDSEWKNNRGHDYNEQYEKKPSNLEYDLPLENGVRHDRTQPRQNNFYV